MHLGVYTANVEITLAAGTDLASNGIACLRKQKGATSGRTLCSFERHPRQRDVSIEILMPSHGEWQRIYQCLLFINLNWSI